MVANHVTGYRRLAARREWLVLVVFLVVLGGFMVHGLVREHDRVQSSESARLHTQARVVDLNIRRQLEGIDQALQAVLRLAGQWGPSAQRIGSEQLEMLANAMPGVRTLTLMDAQGNILAANRPELLGHNDRGLGYFQALLARPNGEVLHVSAPHRSYLGSVAITAARVRLASSGGVGMVATASLNPDYFNALLGSVVSAPDMWAALVHADGLPFQVHPLTASESVARLEAPGSFVQQHSAQASGSSLVVDRSASDAAARLVAVRTVAPPGLQMDRALLVAVGRSEAAMQAPVWQQVRAQGALFAGIVLACGLSLWAAQRRRQQLAELQGAGRLARQQAQERVDQALRGADLGLWDWNLETGQHTLDERGCTMIGSTLAQMQLDRTSWQHRIHPDDEPMVQSIVEELVRGRSQRYEAEYRIRHASGEWVWVLSRGNVVARDANGAVLRMTGTHMDTTERKRAAELIAKGEAALRDFKDMLDETLDCVFILDAQTLRFSYVNEGAIRLSGYDEQQLLRMSPPDLLWDTTAEQYRERTRPMVEGRQASQLIEGTHRHRDGHPVPVEIFVQYLPATTERPARFLAVVRDLTARRAETALKMSEQRFRLLIERAPVAVAIVQHGRFNYTNPRFLAMHGYEEAESLEGKPWREAFAPEDMDRIEHPGAAGGGPNIGEALETWSRCRNGARLPVLVASAGIELSEGAATVLFLQDISALKRAEALLVQARDAAEQASRAKAVFVANMSHEVRTPLNAILGLAYLLERGPMHADETRDLVHKIHLAGRTLLGIVNHVLDISKIEAGRLDIEHAPFRLGDVMASVASILGVGASAKSLELLVDQPPAGTEVLVGDALRLEQVLVNLGGNAIKFTDHGRVLVRVELARREAHRVVLRFAILDTGIGIAPDKAVEIFSPFAQADTSTTRRFGGTGLGLTICRQLVELMGGRIDLESRPGHGSEFWFIIPFGVADESQWPAPDTPEFTAPAVDAAGAAHADAGGARQLEGVRVLVVDDSEINREVAQRILQSHGARIALAHHGQQALDWLDTPGQAVDIVLMDVQMPVMDGSEATRRIRARPALAGLPVVALTAGAFKSQQDEAREAGMDEFLSKPFDVAQAVAIIRRLTRRSAATGAQEATPSTRDGAPARPTDALPRPPTQDAPAAPHDLQTAGLPALDIEQGLHLWSDRAALGRYLRRFVREHGDDAQRIGQRLAAADVAGAAALAHGLRGVAGHLALAGTSEAAAQLERLLHAGEPVDAALQRLQHALLSGLEAIDTLEWARDEEPAADDATPAPSTAQTQALLQRLLQALDADDPSPAEPLLEALAPALAPPERACLRQLLDAFDFRGAQTRVRHLIDALPDPPET
jgi:PAS domain S-box-containing protein